MTGGFIGLFIINFKMTMLVLLFLPIKFFVIKWFAKRQQQIMDEFIIKNQKYAKWFGDTVGGIREIKLFNIFEDKYEEFAHNLKSIIVKQKQVNMLGQWNTIIDTMMIHLLSTFLYILGANMVFNLQLSVGSVFSFITYSFYVTGPISGILNIGYLLSGLIPSTKRYYAFMDMMEEPDDGKYDKVYSGDLNVEQISFAYKKSDYVLKNVTISFSKGSKTAIVGHNGSGKTTLINLLTRMYEPLSGKILLGEKNILEFSLQEYRNIISVVSQQIYLFNDTIRNNICLYKHVSDRAIEMACKDSGLENFIKEVSLDYVVGQNGTMLSGGQKQKIALARAIIYDKPIIIFDEATSSVDAYSEQQISQLLGTRLKEKTVIMITHKKDILNQVDQIVMLKKGMVVGIGTFDQMSSKNNEFKAALEQLFNKDGFF